MSSKIEPRLYLYPQDAQTVQIALNWVILGDTPLAKLARQGDDTVPQSGQSRLLWLRMTLFKHPGDRLLYLDHIYNLMSMIEEYRKAANSIELDLMKGAGTKALCYVLNVLHTNKLIGDDDKFALQAEGRISGKRRAGLMQYYRSLGFTETPKSPKMHDLEVTMTTTVGIVRSRCHELIREQSSLWSSLVTQDFDRLLSVKSGGCNMPRSMSRHMCQCRTRLGKYGGHQRLAKRSTLVFNDELQPSCFSQRTVIVYSCYACIRTQRRTIHTVF